MRESEVEYPPIPFSEFAGNVIDAEELSSLWFAAMTTSSVESLELMEGGVCVVELVDSSSLSLSSILGVEEEVWLEVWLCDVVGRSPGGGCGGRDGGSSFCWKRLIVECISFLVHGPIDFSVVVL